MYEQEVKKTTNCYTIKRKLGLSRFFLLKKIELIYYSIYNGHSV